MKLAGVVVVYNPPNEVINNMKSYLDELDILFVIDNSSNDKFGKFLDVQDIKYIPLLENKGIAYALNLGAKKAIEYGCDYLLTMDQDSCFQQGGVDFLKQFICQDENRSSVGIYSPFHKTTISPDRPVEDVSSPLVVMTSGNIINLQIYNAVGGFKDWFFIDCVDFDYGLNLRKNGFDIKQINSVILEHELGDYEIKHFFGKKVFCDNHSALRRYYIVRNSFYIYDLYHEEFPDYCAAVVNEAKSSFFYATVFEKHGFKKLRYMIRGYLDFKKRVVGPYHN